MLTQKELKGNFKYFPDSGLFLRLSKDSRKRVKPKYVGTQTESGYLRIVFNGKSYQAHRLAHLYMNGKMPENEIDHINHHRSDNRWSNLREVTKGENAKNMTLPLDNTSGVIGVHWAKDRNKWRAEIKVDGVKINLGSFTKFSEAVDIRKLAEVSYGFHENHGKDKS